MGAQGGKAGAQRSLQPEQRVRCGKCCGQIDDKQKRCVPAGQHRQIKVRGQLLDQNVMHKEHRVGYFGKLCAHRAGPRAVQQRAASASRMNTPAPASAQVILPSQGCASTAPASSSGARIYRVRPASVKNVMPNRNSGICTATSRASQPSRCTGMQTASVSAQVSHGLYAAPAAKAGTAGIKTGCCRGTTRPHRQSLFRPSPRQRQSCRDPEASAPA